jgi:hypothetical protein
VNAGPAATAELARQVIAEVERLSSASGKLELGDRHPRERSRPHQNLPGLGKTLIARSFATTLGLRFTRIQFTPDLLPADLTGATTTTSAAVTVFSPAQCSPTCCWRMRSTVRREDTGCVA